jgi:alpha-1,3-rhamnosyl/mannosyltransferase
MFVFPSLYEGFGLPVLEAMQCGCPVVTANNSSLPEVGGDAALYVNAEDDESLSSALLRVLGDEALRRTMVERGLSQAKRFSWRACAEATAAAYRG